MHPATTTIFFFLWLATQIGFTAEPRPEATKIFGEARETEKEIKSINQNLKFIDQRTQEIKRDLYKRITEGKTSTGSDGSPALSPLQAQTALQTLQRARNEQLTQRSAMVKRQYDRIKALFPNVFEEGGSEPSKQPGNVESAKDDKTDADDDLDRIFNDADPEFGKPIAYHELLFFDSDGTVAGRHFISIGRNDDRIFDFDPDLPPESFRPRSTLAGTDEAVLNRLYEKARAKYQKAMAEKSRKKSELRDTDGERSDLDDLSEKELLDRIFQDDKGPQTVSVNYGFYMFLYGEGGVDFRPELAFEDLEEEVDDEGTKVDNNGGVDAKSESTVSKVKTIKMALDIIKKELRRREVRAAQRRRVEATYTADELHILNPRNIVQSGEEVWGNTKQQSPEIPTPSTDFDFVRFYEQAPYGDIFLDAQWFDAMCKEWNHK